MMTKWWMYVYKAMYPASIRQGFRGTCPAPRHRSKVQVSGVYDSTVSRPPLDKQSHGRAHRNRACGANF